MKPQDKWYKIKINEIIYFNGTYNMFGSQIKKETQIFLFDLKICWIFKKDYKAICSYIWKYWTI